MIIKIKTDFRCPECDSYENGVYKYELDKEDLVFNCEYPFDCDNCGCEFLIIEFCE